MQVKVGTKAQGAEFQEFRGRANQDWSEVYALLEDLKPGVPIVIEGVVPSDTPDKEVRKVLATQKASLERYLSNAKKCPIGEEQDADGNFVHAAIEAVQIGFVGRDLAVRLR